MDYLGVFGLGFRFLFILFVAIGLPVAAAASLPLSYRTAKPYWPIWTMDFILAIISSLVVLITFGWLSLIFGTSGGDTGVLWGMGGLNRNFGLPWMVLFLSPSAVAWIMYAYREHWAGLVKPFLLEATIVVLLISLAPSGAFVYMWKIVSDGVQQREVDKQKLCQHVNSYDGYCYK